MYPRSEHGIWVVREADGPLVVSDKGDAVNGPELVAGCCIYPAEGPYAVAEFVSTNPALPKKLLHYAMLMVCQGMSYYGAMVGKTPLCFPKHKGVKRLMEKTGYCYTKPEVQVMYSPFYAPVGVFGGEKTELTSAAATMDSADAAE